MADRSPDCHVGQGPGPGRRVTPTPQPMQVTIPGHLFEQLPFYDVVDNDDTVVVDLHNREDLVNIRGALQGGLLATLIDVAGGRLAIKHAAAGAGTADMSIHFLAPIVEGPLEVNCRRPSAAPSEGRRGEPRSAVSAPNRPIARLWVSSA